MDILVATHNPNKVREIKAIFDRNDIRFLSLSDLKDDEEVEENGSTFYDNALIKASHFAKKHQMITLSDDSGLVVDALDGQPGIYSARYSGNGDHANNLRVLKEMENVENRRAHFFCALVLCYPNGEHRRYEGKVDGYIAREIRGSNGFGYDAIFYMPEYQMTFAELDGTIKNQLSHRGQAVRKFKEDIDEVFDHQ